MIRYGCVGNPKNPAIVMIHGFLGTPYDWASVAGRVDDDLFCVVVTVPGHAGAPISSEPRSGFPEICRDIRTMLDRLEINTAILAGYSLGGRIAIEFSKAESHRVRHLFAISSHFGLENDQERAERLTADINFSKQLAEQPFSNFLEHWYQNPLFDGIQDDPQFDSYISEKIRLHKPAGVATAISQFSLGYQLPFDWNESSFPIDYIYGKNDIKYGVYAHTLPLQDRIQLTSVPDVSHAVLFQAPDAISELILRRMPF